MINRVRVKICGMTTLEDARLAVALGADAVGFIFHRPSPRWISPEEARAIITALPPFVVPVAVIVNASVPTVSHLMTVSGCQVVQYHGPGGDALPYPTITAHAVASEADLEPLARQTAARAFLLDTKADGLHGGTGRTFDWTLARRAQQWGKPVILAGGLTPANVGEAIHTAEPYAVDLNSGVEYLPGRKDPRLLREAFAAVSAACHALYHRDADRENRGTQLT